MPRRLSKTQKAILTALSHLVVGTTSQIAKSANLPVDTVAEELEAMSGDRVECTGGSGHNIGWQHKTKQPATK